MLNRSGYRLLTTFTREQQAFAIWLLANFPLKRFIALNPNKLMRMREDIPWWQPRELPTLLKYIDNMVAAGLLEYGPPVKGWSRICQTVRIKPRMLMTRAWIKTGEKYAEARRQRYALITSDDESASNDSRALLLP